MALDTLDVRMAKLEEAYAQVSKRLDDVHEDVQQLRTELQTGLRSQFWQFAALVLPLWLAAAALFFKH
jgi:hypothetical protein